MNIRSLSRALAAQPPFSHGRVLWEENQKKWSMTLSKWEKLVTGGYLILTDFAEGRFPPKFEDQSAAFEAEIDYREVIPQSLEETGRNELTKPFWYGRAVCAYLEAFVQLVTDFQRLGIAPPQRLLELGCGAGWMAEAFAQMGFDVLGTSIAPADIADGNLRLAAQQSKGLPVRLKYLTGPMETVHTLTKDHPPFDAVYVFEALHHAHDWRATFASAFACLRPGSWLVIANEPNLVHTFVSYRVARLSNTHEIGLSRKEMMDELRRVGFSDVVVLRNRFHAWVKPHWLAAQR
jgi:2-polyprenyl-3-methyl-5-hydroxy-6-metoxy-1,4-benzoquinol methylase